MNIHRIAVIVLCLLLAAENAAAALHGIRAAILVDLTTGRTLYERNANAQIAPASLAKVMTMFLTLDAIKAKKLSLNQKIPITQEAAKAGGSAMRLTAGEKVPVVRLLAGMAVASGNDAATALAIHLAGTPAKFAARMNTKAAKLGMASTKFKNPTGLPAAGQKTTARDLAMLCKAYLKAYPQAKRFHSIKFFMHKGAVARNTNPLLGVVSGVDGLKTGWTVASGYNLIVTAQRNSTRLLAIVLGGQSKAARDTAARTLIEDGFRYAKNPGKLKKIMDGA